ncbi:hypothetical protein [Paenibacillus terrigena]|uniref:hypothetical protein n=1 Tax=Paenibacillus terrigena TaxID=369333 RepID=UPI00035EFA35|nr:hypothetical protein [Paenibacillus terrigena]
MGKQVVFWGPVHGQMGTTSNCISAACMIGFESPIRTLIGSTQGAFSTMESVVLKPSERLRREPFQRSGLDALERLALNQRLTAMNLSDYTIPLLYERLDILRGSQRKNSQEGLIDVELWEMILGHAKQAYDLVMLDENSGIRQSGTMQMLQASDVIVINLNQNAAILEQFSANQELIELLQTKSCVFVLGQYEPGSKYTVRNIARKYKFVEELCTIPRCVDFMDACNDHSVLEFVLRHRNVGSRHPNYTFIQETRRFANTILKHAGVDSEFFCEKGA